MRKKLTFEEWLKLLWQKNKYYREGVFEVVGGYTNSHGTVLVKDKYGEILARCGGLLLGQNVTIKCAVNQTEYFKNKYYDLFPNSGITILGEYKGVHNHVLCETKYGQVLMKPNTLRKGNMPLILSAVNMDEYFRNILLDKNEAYRLGEFEIVGKYTPGTDTIQVRNKYGLVNCSQSGLLAGEGFSIQSADNKFDYWRSMCEDVHNNFYQYPDQSYVDAYHKMTIICPIHGEFKQQSIVHTTGHGCSKCRDKKTSERRKGCVSSWHYSKWCEFGNKSKDFDGFKLYILRIFIDRTWVYKIGKTYVKMRNRTRFIPFQTEVLFTLTLENGYEISKLEDTLKTLHKEYKHVPEAMFGGRHECFTEINFELVNELCKRSLEATGVGNISDSPQEG